MTTAQRAIYFRDLARSNYQEIDIICRLWNENIWKIISSYIFHQPYAKSFPLHINSYSGLSASLNHPDPHSDL